MPWRGPAYDGEFPSLGWDVIDWYAHHLTVPAGPKYGQPFVLTDEQALFIVRAYALHPDGRRVYRRLSLRGAKGKGKSPVGAAWLLGELAGPTVFDGWNADGEPVGAPRPNPWCQVIGVSEESSDNVYIPMMAMAHDSADRLKLDVGKSRIEFRDDRFGKVECVTSSAGAREGTPITAAVKDETQHWFKGRGGPVLSQTVNRNLAKTGGTSLECTNAPALGGHSVAETTMEQATKGQRGLLYESVEAPLVENPKDPDNRDKVMEALEVAYGDAAMKRGGWVDLERIYEEVVDIDVSEADVNRFYFNRAVKDETRYLDPTVWKERALPDAHWPEPGRPVLIFFDGARTRDTAALIGWTLDGDRPFLFTVKMWERPDDAPADFEYNRGEFRRAVADAVERWDCVVAYDSSFHELSSLYDEWHEAYDSLGQGRVIGFPTASGARMEPAILSFAADLAGDVFDHDGDQGLSQHAYNAVLTKSHGGKAALAKPKDTLKIDGIVSAVAGYNMLGSAREVINDVGESVSAYVEFV
jgi:hypothetical protein